MAEHLFGLENEYAFTALDHQGQVLDREAILPKLNMLAREKYAHLPSFQGMSIFLGNGGRLYVDAGLHQEWATPEVTNPWDAVRYLLAGEQMLMELTVDLRRRMPEVAQAIFYRCNVDYSGSGSTWGAHESFMYRSCPPEELPVQVIPHLVSRVIYTGAGGLNPLSPGCEFTLSPRAAFLQREVSGESMRDRGIWHTKDEPLCDGDYHRAHILCSESLCSQTGNFLKAGTTALVVAMADAGLRPGEAVKLRSPVSALRCFADDPYCRASVPSSRGAPLTALSIQRHYLTLAQQHLHDAFMPPWAPQVVQYWREMLDRLETAPDSAAACLDWAIKLRLFKQWTEKKGVAWSSLTLWNLVLSTLTEALREAKSEQKLTAQLALDRRGPLACSARKLDKYMEINGLEWNQISKILQLRMELCEIDIRFGQLGNDGLFAALNRTGALAHAVPGIDNIEHAVCHPPAIGRAHLRGVVIQRLGGASRHHCCDWSVIADPRGAKVLDLSDPWISQEKWNDQGDQSVGPLSGLADAGIRTRLRRVLHRAAP